MNFLNTFTVSALVLFSQDASQAVVDRIAEASTANTTAWQRLGYLGDHFPQRLSGSENLEKAIRWVVEEMKKDGFDNVHTEKVMVPHWVRGEESCEILEPAYHKVSMLGLGASIGTSTEGITGEVLVVKSFEELEKFGDRAKGKIVLYNQPYLGYGKTVLYRGRGASRAAKYGALAALVRSVGPRSLRTPHTGVMGYDPEQPKIPTACVTLEDAEMMQRMQDRGEKIVVKLKMGAKTLPDAESANIIAEIRGQEKPDEVVLLGGHIDSWDIGTGVLDDGGGCVATWEALRLIKQLGLKPRRTIRVVLWTNEENGLQGAHAYHNNHKEEIKNHVLAIELDSGIFKPKGFGFSGSPEARAQIQKLLPFFEKLQATSLGNDGGGADTSLLMKDGVPAMDLMLENENYFDFHHTAADTLDKLKPEDMSKCVAALTAMVYLVSEMEPRLPLSKPTKSTQEN